LSLPVSAIPCTSHVPKRHSPPRDDAVQPRHSGRTRSGDRSPPPPPRCPPAGLASTAPAQSSRPTLLGAALARMEWLAGGRADRETCDRRLLASPLVRLAVALAFRATPSWSPSDPCRRSHGDPQDASRQSPLGAPRIHGGLRKLGIEIAETTVAKYLGRRPSSPSPTWRTFLRTHLSQCASMDFFTVPTATFRVLFVLVVLSHDRRHIVHVNVTDHRPPHGRGSRSAKRFQTKPRRRICCGIATVATDPTSVLRSS